MMYLIQWWRLVHVAPEASWATVKLLDVVQTRFVVELSIVQLLLLLLLLVLLLLPLLHLARFECLLGT